MAVDRSPNARERLGDVELRRMGLRVLARRARTAADATEVAAAAQAAYDDLSAVLMPLISSDGVEALTGRAVYLAQRDYESLIDRRSSDSAQGPIAGVVACLQCQDVASAIDAAGTVFAILTGLLANSIGESLTARLLHAAWPDAANERSETA